MQYVSVDAPVFVTTPLFVVKTTSPGEFGTAGGSSNDGRAGSENRYPAIAPSISGDQLVNLEHASFGVHEIHGVRDVRDKWVHATHHELRP